MRNCALATVNVESQVSDAGSADSEHNLGWLDSSSIPNVLRRLLRPSLTEAPSLHRHYPASSVLRTSPPPHTARPVSRELPVHPYSDPRGASRVASGLLCLVGSRTGARLRRFSRSVAPTFPVGVPYEPNRKLVSSPRLIKPSVQISCTGLS